jgi:hypothetical protein
MRSYDPEILRKATTPYPESVPANFDFEGWLANHRNIMYVVGDNVGLATYEYPGVYNAHWFFTARGKEALDIAFQMYDDLFNKQGAKAVRGITPVDLKGARYLAKRIGFISLGIIEEFSKGPSELMYLSREAFNTEQEKRANGRHR